MVNATKATTRDLRGVEDVARVIVVAADVDIILITASSASLQGQGNLSIASVEEEVDASVLGSERVVDCCEGGHS